MAKFFLFVLLWRLLGNPVLAVIVFAIVLYLLDRRYVGFSPNLLRPFQQSRRLSLLRQELGVNPHQTSAKLEVGRILLQKKRVDEAAAYFEQVLPQMPDSAEVKCELGICYLRQGRLEEGEALIAEGLAANPRVKYGEPYLRLGEAYAGTNPEKALHYLEQFREVQSSSCEAYYRLGQLYERLGRSADAKAAYREAVEIYRVLPKYKRKSERSWMLKSRWKG